MKIVLIDRETGKERDITQLIDQHWKPIAFRDVFRSHPPFSSISYSLDDGASWKREPTNRIAHIPHRIGRPHRRGKL